MLLFSLKIFKNLRKAIAGRRYPAQLAGGLALGVLLGIIPHGNFLAVVVLMGVLCFQVNHAFLALVAIATAFGASQLDPYSHEVGNFLLMHPEGNAIAKQLWTYPMVPWMDLNNTVVLGSFVIGLTAALPLFLLTYPVFKWLAPAPDSPTQEETEAAIGDEQEPHREADTEGRQHRIDSPTRTNRPAQRPQSTPSTTLPQQPVDYRTFDPGSTQRSPDHPVSSPIDEVLENEPDFMPIEEASDETGGDTLPTREEMVAVDTRIDVIRMTDYRDSDTADSDADEQEDPQQKMDEALTYLLQQLRQTQTKRKAAG